MSLFASDTLPGAAAVQLGLLRGASLERRAALARSLSVTTIDLSRQALRQLMPTATERDVLDSWVSSNYGADLARRIQVYLSARS